MNNKILNESLSVTQANVCPIVEQMHEQVKENKTKIEKIDTKLWLIIVLIASTLGTSVIDLLCKIL